MPDLQQLLGKEVVTKSGTLKVADLTGDDKIIGVYFSAHWCPPCKHFTPVLAEWYKKQKAGPHGARLEVVFVSSDRDKASFDNYYGSMPWAAVPFEDRDRKTDLCDEFEVLGIPTLIFLTGKGEEITRDGRAKVTSNIDIPF